MPGLSAFLSRLSALQALSMFSMHVSRLYAPFASGTLVLMSSALPSPFGLLPIPRLFVLLPRLSAPPFRSTSGIRVPRSSALFTFGAPVPGFFAPLFLFGCLSKPGLSAFLPGSSALSFLSMSGLGVSGLFVLSPSGYLFVLRPFPPGSYPPFPNLSSQKTLISIPRKK